MRKLAVRPVRQSGTRRRETILRAATDLFLECGFEKTSLSNILSRSGGSRRTIYEQFKDKEGLFEAIMEEQCRHMLSPMNDPGLFDGRPEEILDQIAQCFLKVMTTPAVASLRRIAMGEGRKFPRVAKIFVRSGVDPAIAQVGRAFELLNARGFYYQDPQFAALMFLSMIQGDSIDRLTIGGVPTRSPEALQKQVEFAISAVLSWGKKAMDRARLRKHF